MVLIGVITFFCTLLLTTQVQASNSGHLYAGYYLKRYEHYDPYGVRAVINTIDPSVPSGQNFLAEWDTIVLSYRLGLYGYWIQLGYLKGWDSTYQQFFDYPVYYWEKWDSSGYTHRIPGVPNVSRYITYTIQYAPIGSDPGRYKWIIYDEGAGTKIEGYISVYPYDPRDLQAFVETTTSQIRITCSYFLNLSLTYDGVGWAYWGEHVPEVDPPYTLTEISHHEFMASGGG